MADLTLRNARTTIENAIVDSLNLAYGVRLPAAADITALRALASTGLTDRALRFVTSAGATYQWARFSTATDDGVNAVQPADVATGKPGRWAKTTSTVATGYLKNCELYNDDSNDLDTFEQRLFGAMPAMLLSFDNAEHEPKSTEAGALYWAKYHFTLFAVSVNARANQTTRQGSLIASEAAIDPGTAAMIGDAKATLAGFDLGLNDVGYVQIENEQPVVRDLARARFVESLDLTVYATLTNPDTANVTTLADPYEFNMQMQLVDTDASTIDASYGTFDPSNYVTSDGLRIPLGDGLTKSYAGGGVYIAGVLVTVLAGSKTFTASKVTYRDVLGNGSIVYIETNVGDEPPALTYGAVRLGVTVTDDSGVRLDRILATSLISYGPSNKVDPPTLISIAISPVSISVAHGTQIAFTATGTFDDASTLDITDLVTWSSSATSVATISVAGIATTIAVGVTNISATRLGITSNTAALTAT